MSAVRSNAAGTSIVASRSFEQSGLIADVKRFVRHRRGGPGFAVLVVIVGAAIFAPIVAPSDPLQVAPERALQAPSLAHLMGTDQLGRDLLSRVIFGARVSLVAGLIAVAISLTLGSLLGLLAGYYARTVDVLISWLTNVLLAFPGVLLALGVVAVLRPGITQASIAVGIAGIPRFIRLVRGSVLAAKANVYVDAARTVGCPEHMIMFRHILPNVTAPVIVLASLDIAQAILIAAALSFLGIGAQPPEPEWGALISSGRNYMSTAWWISTLPGLVMLVALLAINVVGDGLRDVLDPRLKNRG